MSEKCSFYKEVVLPDFVSVFKVIPGTGMALRVDYCKDDMGLPLRLFSIASVYWEGPECDFHEAITEDEFKEHVGEATDIMGICYLDKK